LDCSLVSKALLLKQTVTDGGIYTPVEVAFLKPLQYIQKNLVWNSFQIS
jgi:hypothetical protein